MVCFPRGKKNKNGNLLGHLSLLQRWKKITTGVFSKHNHSYLPTSSCHSPAVLKEFAQRIGTRLRMICSQDTDLDRRIGRMCKISYHLGMPVQNCRGQPCGRGKEEQTKTSTTSKEDKGKENLHGLAPTIPECLFKRPSSTRISISFIPTQSTKISSHQEPLSQRTGKEKNLAQIYKPTVPQRHVHHGPQNKQGFFPCGYKCDTCRHSKETTVLVSPWDGRHWPIKQNLTCTTPNTVYVVMCTVHNDCSLG